ncbi:hypothetical protein ACFS5L_32195 [Streptomyces phyllanthi]|uniref:Uncharacterized protein n=1 Tax=Streptomyces phyllanthi TaxID=1803180 RepID=A0A5N8WDX9_9ACTN|nr:hypothetical protein [Streptomyces phyllanthi]MPY45650.1 hypothetical protein [Streptomyces phyllanthi]
MTTPTPERDSGWITGGHVDAEDARLATGVLAAPGDGPIQARSGVKPAAGNPGQVFPTATVSGKVTVNPFQAVIQGTRATAAGAYLVTMDQTKTIDVLGTAPATANPRFDLIVARQRDAQYGDASTGMSVELVPGKPDPNPVVPEVTGDHIRLARISVPANATTITAANIFDERPYTAAAGGVVRVWNERPANPHIGLYVHHVQTHRLEVYTGGDTWRTVYEDTGWTTLSLLPNWTVYLGETPAVRRIGSTVHLRGALITSVAISANSTSVINVPAGFRPAVRHHYYAPLGNSRQGVELLLAPDGNLLVFPHSTALPANQLIYINTTWLVG